MWKVWLSNLKTVTSLSKGEAGCWRWPQSLLRHFGAKFNFLPHKKWQKKQGYFLHWHWWKKFPEEIRLHVSGKTSQWFLWMISYVEFCCKIQSLTATEVSVTHMRFSQTVWWELLLPSAAGWRSRCKSIQLCRNKNICSLLLFLLKINT